MAIPRHTLRTHSLLSNRSLDNEQRKPIWKITFFGGDNTINQTTAPLNGKPDSDIKNNIEMLLVRLAEQKADLYSMKSVTKVEPQAIVNMYLTTFYKSWIIFYDLTCIAFNPKYRAEHKELGTLMEKIIEDNRNVQYRKAMIDDVDTGIKNFDAYLLHIAESGQIKLR